MTTISIGLLALVVAMAAFAVWVMVDLHNVIGYIFGGVLLCVTGALRPRFDKLDKLADPPSVREQASLFRTQPPSGLRAQMMASRPQTSAKVVLTESDALRIDQELAKQSRSMRSTLIN